MKQPLPTLQHLYQQKPNIAEMTLMRLLWLALGIEVTIILCLLIR